jgi:hypothetical protein
LTTGAGVATAALVVAWWAGGMPEGPRATSSPTPSASDAAPSGYSLDVVVEGQLVHPTALDVSDAADPLAAGRIVETSTPVLASPDAYVRAVSAEGEVVATLSAHEGLRLSQDVVGALGAGGVVRRFSGATPPGVDPTVARQSESFSVSGRTVAWAETPSTDLLYDNWSVYAADLDTGATVALGSSEDVLPGDLLPIIGPYMRVSAGKDRVFWGTPYPRGERGADGHYTEFGLEVLARRIDGVGPLEVVADNAILPSADGDCVAFARIHGSDPDVPEGTYRIIRVCGVGGPEVLLASGSLGAGGALSSLTAADGLVAWAQWDSRDGQATRADVVVLDTSTGRTTTVRLTPPAGMLPEPVAELSAADGLVSWSTTSTRGLLDVPVGTVWSLDVPPGLTALLQAGAWLGWPAADEQGVASISIGRWERS